MEGKTVLVTGASTGIGFVTALELARQGAHVIMVSRDAQRAEEARKEIQLRAKSAKLDVMLADLSSLVDIRDLAERVKAKYPRLDVLVNNAGVISGKRIMTRDGFEFTFALDHLGYFFLTQELMPLLKASAPARIINVSSEAHRGGQMYFEDLHLAKGYSAIKAYCQAKLANLLFTFELARMLEGTGITVNAVHPGAVATSFGSTSSGIVKVFVMLFRPFMRSREKGAETTIYLAYSPEVANTTGKYFIDKREARPSKRALLRKDQERLWKISEELVNGGV
jgi:NAD(P)-dependent dehydrogenase (short-subunit alcohol dehydrogenase family)